jgi:CO/xanthine dehydrogenase Mo-binding subunit
MTGLIPEKEFSRRSFLARGGALVVGFSVLGAAVGSKAGAAVDPFTSSGPPDPNQIDSWLIVHPDNTVSLLTGRVELGQGTSVGLSLIAAEELDLDLQQMQFVRHDTNVTPNTGLIAASSSIEQVGPYVRAAAVSARQVLLNLAAQALGVADPTTLSVKSGVVSSTSGKSVSYGQVLGGKVFNVAMPAGYGMTSVTAVSGRTAPGLAAGGPGAKSVANYKIIGTVQPRFDIPAKVAGTFTYVHNLRVPGMLHGRVVRPRGQSAYPNGASVVSVDPGSISQIPGVKIVQRGDFVAVVAQHEYDAIQAAALLKVIWAPAPTIASSGNMWGQMRTFDTAGQAPARIQLESGTVDAAFASAAKTLSATYKYNQQGHLPVGPTCSVADVTPSGAVVFSNTQDAYALQGLLAPLLNLPLKQVRVIWYEGSSCYGGSPYDDGALAAGVASQLAGAPVRMQFMRWDEHGWDNFGPILMADVRAGIDANGKVVAHEYTGFLPPTSPLYNLVQQQTGAPLATPAAAGTQVGSGRPVGRNPEMIGEQYHLPNRRVIAKSLPLNNNYFKQRFLRTVGSTPASFANEQMMDELAHAAQMDPLQFRLNNIGGGVLIGPGTTTLSDGEAQRAGEALQAAASLAGWQPRVAASQLQTGTIVSGRGIAVGGLNGTWAAAVAQIEVNKKTGKITVQDLWGAEQAGFPVGKDQIENQMIGCLVTGTSRALMEQIVFNTQRVTSLDWVTYPSLRFADSPRVHVTSVVRLDLQPHGSGEPTLTPVPAAIANAFFDATGVRIREAPMTPARVRGVLAAAGAA